MHSEAFRHFQYPLNVFMLILHAEEPEVPYLHYGIFDREGESLVEAQRRSTALLREQLPSPPASILDVGIGLGTTLSMLLASGYAAEGITPDPQQVEAARAKFGEDFPVTCTRFEELPPTRTFDAVVFQESAQYVSPAAIFHGCAAMTKRVVILDEFAAKHFDQAGSLHHYGDFLETARAYGFELKTERNLSEAAAPTVGYFLARIPSYRQRIREELEIGDPMIDDLLRSGKGYLESYAAGDYVYKLLVFERA